MLITGGGCFSELIVKRFIVSALSVRSHCEQHNQHKSLINTQLPAEQYNKEKLSCGLFVVVLQAPGSLPAIHPVLQGSSQTLHSNRKGKLFSSADVLTFIYSGSFEREATSVFTGTLRSPGSCPV